MAKTIIYQILPRLWGKRDRRPVKDGTLEENGSGKFSDIDAATLEHIGSLGASYVWLTGVIRHATGACWVKGKAGSPYSISDYYDVNPYLADYPEHRTEEFEALVERIHNRGMKVMIDFVPNHVARDYETISAYLPDDQRLGAGDDTSVHWAHENDFYYYPGEHLRLPQGNGDYEEFPAKASGNCYSCAPSVSDWYDTIKINYCDTYGSTWEKMYNIVRFWAAKGVDGFRCDMVELVPPAFFKWLIAKIREEFPEVKFLAEVYQKNLYSKYIREVGFDWLYDKSGLYDALRDIVEANVVDRGVPVEQWQSARRITWNWQFLGDLQPYMLNFLENHDEQRFASDFFGADGADSYAALHASAFLNTAPFMIYFGQEIGERGMDEEGFSGRDGRTSIFDWWAPEGTQRLYEYLHGENTLSDKQLEMLQRYRAALSFAASDKAVSEGAVYDLCYCNYASDGFNKDRHFAFLRSCAGETLLVLCNFSGRLSRMKLVIPEHAFSWLGLPRTEGLNPDVPVELSVAAHDAVVLRLS